MREQYEIQLATDINNNMLSVIYLNSDKFNSHQTYNVTQSVVENINNILTNLYAVNNSEMGDIISVSGELINGMIAIMNRSSNNNILKDYNIMKNVEITINISDNQIGNGYLKVISVADFISKYLIEYENNNFIYDYQQKNE
eukprot:127070_1